MDSIKAEGTANTIHEQASRVAFTSWLTRILLRLNFTPVRYFGFFWCFLIKRASSSRCTYQCTRSLLSVKIFTKAVAQLPLPITAIVSFGAQGLISFKQKGY